MPDNMQNSVLVQMATLADIEAIVNRAIEKKMKDFYENIRSKPPVLISRQKAASSEYLNCSLPTLDKYGKFGILHPKHVGGRVYYEEEELLRHCGKK